MRTFTCRSTVPSSMETSIGYESRMCTQAVQGGLLRGHQSTPVKHKHMLFPPACSSPLITEDLPGSRPGRYTRMDMGQSLTTIVCTNHILSGTISFCLQACYACYQARLHDVLGRKSMYVGQWLKHFKKFLGCVYSVHILTEFLIQPTTQDCITGKCAGFTIKF
jgi:hypothetical protein